MWESQVNKEGVKKIQDWIFKSERIRKWILRFFSKQINLKSFGSWCIKGTEESTSRVDSSVPLTHHNPRDLGLICLVKNRKIRVWIPSDLRIQSWIFSVKETHTKISQTASNAVRLFSNRSQMTSKFGKNKRLAHEAIAECFTDVLATF